MIFITGGNFQQLDASLPVYYPERFVNNTNVIAGFIQYRLGKFAGGEMMQQVLEHT